MSHQLVQCRQCQQEPIWNHTC